jgi:hypothetical protein
MTATMPRSQRLRWIPGGLLSSSVMRSISFGFAVLTAVLLTACAIDNPTDVRLPDAGPCGTMGAACCPTVATAPNGARTICRASGTTCSAGTCVACGAPGQPCCAGAATGDGGTSMDAGLAGSCTGAGVACLASMCVDCSGPDRAVCNGQCVSLTTDQNCGACGTACATTSGERCTRTAASGVDGGVTDAGPGPDGGARVAFCQIQCPPGQVLCGNTCRDLTSDPNNCRTCGNQCNLPGAVSGCSASACTLASCRDGFGNCDNVATNGCETATSTDVMNCGVCGNRCSFANAAATCAAGRCMRGACNPGFADCDGNPANGCEVNTAMGDITNCGTCGMRCPTPPVGASAVCRAGTCQISTVVCTVGLGNCDGNDGNGCETTTLNDVNNCGIGGNSMPTGCGNRCSSTGGTPACNGGVCSITCNAGLGNCDGNVSNGCETNTNTTVAHCGACGRACALPNVSVNGCAAGACTVTTCTNGFGNCDGTASNGCETNLNVDGNNCGTCGRACPGGQTCQMGMCQTICATGQRLCSGTCINPATDNANCGGCGVACTGGTSCSGGSCVCPAGQTLCGTGASATCRALQTDNANCGACGTPCGAGTVCSAGVCTSTCAPGTNPCTVGSVTTCRDLQNDANNCATCGTVCSRTQGVAGCRTGACFLAACNTGFANCDGNDSNGCETNTGTSASNCGVCGNICQFANAGATCVAGRCTMGTCATGFRDCNNNPVDGCEVNVDSGDITHCGACTGATAVCPTPPVGTTAVCRGGLCTTSTVSCPSDRRDCNASSGDGCETTILTDINNCGACGNVCPRTGGTATCTGGVCGITCNANLGNCDGLLNNGCETDLRTSAANCTACNVACSAANATPSCSASVCGVASCNTGFGNCDGLAGNGCERNLNSDNANCGACGNICPSGQVCSGGTCQVSCGSLAVCSGTCRDTAIDPDNCSGCGMACSATGMATRTCAAGTCNGTCATGRADCNANLRSDGCETDTNATATACGGCGMACSTSNITAACSGGNCTGTCATGFADCNANKRTDGCEINITNNASNCGGCGTVCPARANAMATPCVASACTIGACIGTFANCNGMAADGCEVNTATDANNCSGCGNACPARAHATSTCSGSACGFTCLPGFGDCDGMPSTGCETALDGNPNCGACGVTCNGGPMCTAVTGMPGIFSCQ